MREDIKLFPNWKRKHIRNYNDQVKRRKFAIPE